MVEEKTVRGQIGEKEISFSTGKLAKLADGAVVVSIGKTQVLTTATARREVREGADFFPLTIDVEERMYAVGRIPGSFFRREGRATEKAILTCRLIDRPLRPNFSEGFRCETHVLSTILSADLVHPYDVPALNASSAALSISAIPFDGPVGAIRLGLIEGEWVPFPTFDELENAVFDLVVAGKKNESGDVDIVMVEAGATEEGFRLVQGGQPSSDEETVARGLDEAKGYIATLVDLQNELAAQVGEPAPVEWPSVSDFSDEIYDRVAAAAADKIGNVVSIADKMERAAAQSAARDEVIESLGFAEDDGDSLAQAKKAFRAVMKKSMRQRVIDEGIRLDGRGATDIRDLHVEVDVVHEGHGSGLFQRGETQVLNVSTLGMLRMEQMLDTISIEETKRFMHHYNFPPFATGETGFMRGPKRREIGHGALAEKALLPVIPPIEDFPYAFRLVSEVLMSNGSSSMASVCGSSLSLMDAGVPIHAPVAGIAMGLIAHDGGYITLTDILGAEDALGDMDFKVAGT
ncbi:MAG: polyribonucleotide nucleotidyltransferase, partial [Acidimicrobiia bacterium]|nr:polyribonucleotide nucleotidyltransferase [Acidimicrobiia bacterium]